MVYRVAIERCGFRLLDAAPRRIAESPVRGSGDGTPPAGCHVNLYVWNVSGVCRISARGCQYINWMICRPAAPPFETVRLRDALSRRVKVNAGGGRPSQRVLKRPGGPVPTPWWRARSRSFTHPLPLVFQTTHSHTFTRTNARRKQLSAGKVSLPCERAHAATPSASQHVSKHPTGRHGSGGIPAAAGEARLPVPRQRRCVIMPPHCPPDASVARPDGRSSCGASLGRSPSKQ